MEQAAQAFEDRGGAHGSPGLVGVSAAPSGGPPAGRVLAVGCRPLVSLGLGALLAPFGVTLMDEAPDVDAALARAGGLPDVFLVDLTRTARAGDALRRLSASAPAARVVVSVSPFDERAALEALAAGVLGCVAEEGPIDELPEALRAAVRGESFVSPRIARRLSRRLGLRGAAAPPHAVRLTEREREVLRLLARGDENAAIAAALHLSRATVKHHIAAIFAKLGVANRVQAAVRAVQDDLVDL